MSISDERDHVEHTVSVEIAVWRILGGDIPEDYDDENPLEPLEAFDYIRNNSKFNLNIAIGNSVEARELKALKKEVEEAEKVLKTAKQLIQLICSEIEAIRSKDYQSPLVFVSPRSGNISRQTLLTKHSVYQWAKERDGTIIAEWAPLKGQETRENRQTKEPLEDVDWADVTVSIYANHRIGCQIKGGKAVYKNLIDIDLLNKKKAGPKRAIHGFERTSPKEKISKWTKGYKSRKN